MCVIHACFDGFKHSQVFFVGWQAASDSVQRLVAGLDLQLPKAVNQLCLLLPDLCDMFIEDIYPLGVLLNRLWRKRSSVVEALHDRVQKPAPRRGCCSMTHGAAWRMAQGLRMHTPTFATLLH